MLSKGYNKKTIITRQLQQWKDKHMRPFVRRVHCVNVIITTLRYEWHGACPVVILQWLHSFFLQRQPDVPKHLPLIFSVPETSELLLRPCILLLETAFGLQIPAAVFQRTCGTIGIWVSRPESCAWATNCRGCDLKYPYLLSWGLLKKSQVK